MIYGIADERQTGKTELAIELFLNDPENTIFLVCNLDTRQRIITRMGARLEIDFLKNIKLFHKEILRGLSEKRLIIDEPFYKKKWAEVIMDAKLNFETIYVLGTYKDKIKDKNFMNKFTDTLSDIKTFKERGFHKTNVLINFENFYDENGY